jgi:protein-disulfide isomerase
MPTPSLRPPIGDNDHIRGPADASIELVEYGDFECPHCGKAAVIVNQLIAELGDRLRFAYRHFPLSKIHPHARKAAQASEAAAAQGRFWEMHDLMFAKAPALEVPKLIEYAGELGLDVPRFEQELTSDTWADRVQSDIAGGVRSGVNGTPTFFINGQRHNRGYEITALREAMGV